MYFYFDSLQDWTQEELSSHSGDMHKNVEKEKRIRENILDIRQALAKEVTQKTREVAGLWKTCFIQNVILFRIYGFILMDIQTIEQIKCKTGIKELKCDVFAKAQIDIIWFLCFNPGNITYSVTILSYNINTNIYN